MDKSVKKMRPMDESRRQTTPGRAFMNNWQKAQRSYESQIERWKTSSVCPVWRSSQNWKTRKMQIILSSDRCPGAFYWENARQRYTPVRRFPMSSIVFICVRRAFDISWIHGTTNQWSPYEMIRDSEKLKQRWFGKHRSKATFTADGNRR